jgi:hypothetical protein
LIAGCIVVAIVCKRRDPMGADITMSTGRGIFLKFAPDPTGLDRHIYRSVHIDQTDVALAAVQSRTNNKGEGGIYPLHTHVHTHAHAQTRAVRCRAVRVRVGRRPVVTISGVTTTERPFVLTRGGGGIWYK